MYLLNLLCVLLKAALTCAGQQQECSVDRLPVFGSTHPRLSPHNDRFQAIVPAYTFQCSGRVTEWRACVHPGGNMLSQYYIQFQVWRSTGIDGCYELVGYNTKLNADRIQESGNVIIIYEGGEGVLVPGTDNAPDRCVVLPVTESQQIEFQPGDVIGYYVDYFYDEHDKDYGGIHWIEDEDEQVKVYYRFDLPREDIKSQYAIGIPNIDPSVCGFPTETSDLHSLSNVATSAPVISLSIGK